MKANFSFSFCYNGSISYRIIQVPGCHQPWCYKVYYLDIYCYFSLSSGDLTSTSSQKCGSWYLPIFLFRNRSLTLVSIASLMALVMLWSHYAKVIQRYFIASDVEVVMYGWWSSHMFSEPFSKYSAWCPYILLFTVYPTHTCICKSLHSSGVCHL